MGSFNDYLRNKVLDHIFGATAYTAPSTLYLGLSTTTIAAGGTNITEPSGNGYARKNTVNNSTNFPNAAAGSKSNATAIPFAQATGTWGTIVDFFISDAVSGGNILGFGALTASKTVGIGDTVSFGIGGLTITLA